ncbi:Flavin-containing monooxygenase FMO GS-OX-like 3 [Striga hermonthica]|uniref:Flavin-containing monooxygenase n=1 Tax=Striga hermonthica TaxID=68872 RepID=A0A9N7QYT0_STRHE|nr:Flavin-containing monooxygenase FMO GS-OX-like 3 [Striga hermonthica]
MRSDTSSSPFNSNDLPTASQPLNVAVIGAGVSGLSAAVALKSEGHRVVAFEKSDQLGGLWVYDPRAESDPLGLDPNREIVHGSLYRSLRTNIPRQMMGFCDYPFATRKNRDSRTFPGHVEVLEFLKQYAADHGLADLIRLGTEVVRVERVESGSGEWVVESRKDELSSIEVFDAVVVCSGHHTIPRLADFPGMEKWPGKQMHSHNYRVPEPFQDQIVVVIGSGPSARDISLEISVVAKEVHLSSRSPNVKISKLDCGFNMWQHSKIDHVNESGEVVFQDGASIRADIILHCTGYKFEFPFLKTEGIVTVDDNRVGPLYKHVFPPKLAPKLSFIGLSYNSGVVFLMVDLQAKWIAHVLSGKVNLPSEEEMMAEVEDHYRFLDEKGIPKHHTHNLFHKNITASQLEYLDWVACQVGLKGVDDQTRLVLQNYFQFWVENGGLNYRDWEFDHGFQQVCQS